MGCKTHPAEDALATNISFIYSELCVAHEPVNTVYHLNFSNNIYMKHKLVQLASTNHYSGMIHRIFHLYSSYIILIV